MDVHTLPVTSSTNDIQDDFLWQLSRRVNIKDPINIQIIIFKPIGRPREEFDNVIQEFIKRGGRLDGDIIFITAMTFGQCQFEAPSNFKFVLQTSVYLTDEFKIEQRSDAAMDEIADFLINKYGIQRISDESPWQEVVSGKARFLSEPEKKAVQEEKFNVLLHKNQSSCSSLENVHTLPVTSSTNDIQENFLQQLSRRVNIKGNEEFNKVQIIIFKPVGKPSDEFDNVIQLFQKRGGRLDGDIIFITAMTYGQCQFEAPSNFKFVLQTSVYLTDEFKIEQRSDAAMDEIADFLINKYGIQRYLPKSHGLKVVSRKNSTGDESKDKEKMRRYTNDTSRNIANLNMKLCDPRREIHDGSEEKRHLERIVCDLKREIHDRSEEKRHLERIVDDLMTNIGDRREQKRELERNVDDLMTNIGDRHEEKRHLERIVDELKKEIHERHEEIRKLERNVLVEEDRLNINVLQREDIRSNRKSFNGADQNKFIRFEFQSKSKCCFGQKEKIYCVSLSAVEDEMKNIQNENYHFQRKLEKKFHLKPGVIFDLLEFIRREFQNTSEDGLIIEGERFVSLVDGVDRKFGLPEDHFRRLLKTISKRHLKEIKRRNWPSTDEMRRHELQRVEIYNAGNQRQYRFQLTY